MDDDELEAYDSAAMLGLVMMLAAFVLFVLGTIAVFVWLV